MYVIVTAFLRGWVYLREVFKCWLGRNSGVRLGRTSECLIYMVNTVFSVVFRVVRGSHQQFIMM